MQQFFVIGQQVLTFAFILVLGLICAKFKVLNKDNLASLSRLVLRVVMPILIFNTTVSTATREGLGKSLLMLPVMLVVYALLWCIAALLVRLFRLTGNRAKVFRAITMFGNVGFVGIPLVSALCPQNGMLYVALASIVDLGLYWTLGVYYSLPADYNGKLFSKDNLKKMLSPALISIVVSVIAVLCGLHFPPLVQSMLQSVSNTCMPLSLIYLGGLLYFTDLTPALKSGALYAEIVVKMLVFPIAAFALMKLLGLPLEMRQTVTTLIALPAISSVAMLSYQHGSDGDFAIGAIMITTLACLVVLPLVSIGMSLIG